MASIENSSKFTSNDLNTRVEVLDAIPSILDDGTRTLRYASKGSRWANVSITNTKNESENGEEVRRTTTYRIVIRYKKGLVSNETIFKYVYNGAMLRQLAPPIRLTNDMLLIDCVLLGDAAHEN